MSSEDERPTSGYVPVHTSATAGNTGGKDFFGTFYFWTMLTGMAVLAICATVVVKQRIAALELISVHSQKSALGRVAALSLAATQNQAEGLVNSGQPVEAIKLFEEWLHRNRNSEKWSAQLVAEQQLSRIYSLMGDFDSALKCAEQGLSIADKHSIKSGPEYEDLLLSTAAILTAKNDFKRSMALSAEAMDITQDMEFNHELDSRLISFNNIARCQQGLGQLEEAERTATEGLDLAERSYGTHSSAYADACKELATLCELRKQYPRALAYINKTIDALAKSGCRYNEPLLLARAYKAFIEAKAEDAPAALSDYTYVSSEFQKSPHIHFQIENELKNHMSRVAAYLGKTADSQKWR
jgi:tetratricopeptide (TPR) repeat protein